MRIFNATLFCAALIFGSCVHAANLLAPIFADPATHLVRLSPDGGRYVIAETRQEKTVLRVFRSTDRAMNQQLDLTRLFEQNTVLRDLQWLDNTHLAAMMVDRVQTETALQERNLQFKLRIFKLAAQDQKPVIYEVSTPGHLVDGAADEEGVFYFSRSGHKSKIYRIEIARLLEVDQKRTKLTRADGGQFIENNVIAAADGYAIRWFFQRSGLPAAVLLRTDEDTISLALYRSPDESLSDSQENSPSAESEVIEEKTLSPETVKSWKMSDFINKDNIKQSKPSYIPIAMAAGSNKFYCLDANEPQAFSLYLVDFKAQTHERIFASPGQPIVDLIFSKNRSAIGVKVIEQGLYKESYFDGQPSELNTEILQVVTASSLDGNTQIMYRESHNQPGQYLLRHNKNQAESILSQFEQLPDALPSRQVMGKVKVEELTIPYILTLPQSASNSTPVSLIVMPHGGPFDVYDSPYFSPETQFFAANNIATLRVNFRGSGGYGIDHKNAGKKQWGDNMLLDILSATKAVQQRQDIDPARTCVVGMSYGGYAALMLGLTQPEVFKCIVSVAGVTDINLFVKSPYLSSEQQEWVKEHVGDSNTDYEKFKSISPIYNLNRLTIPLLLIHGAKDQVVNVENAYRVKRLLEASNTPFEWQLFPQAGHDFSKDDQLIRLYADILRFVQHNVTK